MENSGNGNESSGRRSLLKVIGDRYGTADKEMLRGPARHPDFNPTNRNIYEIVGIWGMTKIGAIVAAANLLVSYRTFLPLEDLRGLTYSTLGGALFRHVFSPRMGLNIVAWWMMVAYHSGTILQGERIVRSKAAAVDLTQQD